jgi:hypothetical protein
VFYVHICKCKVSQDPSRRIRVVATLFSPRQLRAAESERARLMSESINEYFFDKWVGFGFQEGLYQYLAYNEPIPFSLYNVSGLGALILLSILPRILRSSEIDDENMLEQLVQSVFDSADLSEKFRRRIAYEVFTGKSVNLSDESSLQHQVNLPFVPLASAIAGSLIGGGTLDMSGKTLPDLMWVLFHGVSNYDMLGVEYLGPAACADCFNIVVGLNHLGIDLLFVAQEIQYCPEVSSNARKLFDRHNSGASTNISGKPFLSKFSLFSYYNYMCSKILICYHLQITYFISWEYHIWTLLWSSIKWIQAE